MKIKKLNELKKIVSIIHKTDIVIDCAVKIESTHYPFQILIGYENYIHEKKYLLFIKINKFKEEWNKEYSEYMELKQYIENCVKHTYPNINIKKVSKMLFDYIYQILDDNQIENLWE